MFLVRNDYLSMLTTSLLLAAILDRAHVRGFRPLINVCVIFLHFSIVPTSPRPAASLTRLMVVYFPLHIRTKWLILKSKPQWKQLVIILSPLQSRMFQCENGKRLNQ